MLQKNIVFARSILKDYASDMYKVTATKFLYRLLTNLRMCFYNYYVKCHRQDTGKVFQYNYILFRYLFIRLEPLEDYGY